MIFRRMPAAVRDAFDAELVAARAAGLTQPMPVPGDLADVLSAAPRR